MDQWLAAGDRDHRRAALHHRVDRLRDSHPLAQDRLGLLDLAAAGAGEIALEQRLELDDQRELLPARHFLAGEVPADAGALTHGDGHLDLLHGSAAAGGPRPDLERAHRAAQHGASPAALRLTVASGRWTSRSGVSTTTRTTANGRPAAAGASQALSMSTAIAPAAARRPRASPTTRRRAEAIVRRAPAGPHGRADRRAPRPRGKRSRRPRGRAARPPRRARRAAGCRPARRRSPPPRAPAQGRR